MKKLNHYTHSLKAIAGVTLLLPQLAFAQGVGKLEFNLINPLGATTVEGLITSILAVLITLATPIVVLFIIYAGFLYVTANGNAEQLKKSTRALTYAIIGGIILIGAVALSGIIEGIVDAFRASP